MMDIRDVGVEYKISLDGGVSSVITLQAGCDKPKEPAPEYPIITLTAPPPITFTSPSAQTLMDYKIYGSTVGGQSVGDLVASGEHTGEYAVPVTVAKGTQSETKNIYLSAPLAGAHVYGFRFNSAAATASDAIEYLGDAVGKTPAAMGANSFSYGDWADAFFMPRPCMLKYDGTVDYYLDPDNYNLKADDGSIPAGYKAVEYIETTGTQYINTDILINSYTDTVVDAKFYFDGAKEASPYGGYLFGATDDSSTGITFSADTTDWNNATTFWCGFPYKISSSTDWIYNIRSVILNGMSYYHFSLADLHCNAIDGHLAINGRDQALTVRPTPQTSTLPTSTLTIFGNNSNGTVTVYPFAGLRLYRFTITEKVNNVDTVTHNLIPAERQSDGELGMYDTVTGDFYTNSGTGTFLKGGYGIASDIESEAYPGNAMMEWPKIWYKFEAGENPGEGYFYVSDTKVDDTYHCWCNYDIQDNEIDHFYTSIYHGSNDGNKMRSLSGWNSDYPAPRYKTVADLAVANNINGYEEWNTETFADRQLIDALVMLIGKTADLSAVFGKGIYGQSNVQSAVTGYTMGSLNDKGLFWGDTSSGDHAVKIFGMENWWGLMPHTVAGVHISGTTLYYKLTPGQADGSTVTGFKERTWSGSTYVESGYLQKTIPSGVGGANTGYISAFDFSDGIYFMSELAQSVTKFNQNCTRPNTYVNITKLLAFGAIAGSDTPNGIGKMEAYQYYQGWNVCGLSCKPIAAESSTTTQSMTRSADYLDYGAGKRYDMDGTETTVTLPDISLYQGQNTLSVGTTIQPSEVSIKGRGIAETD